MMITGKDPFAFLTRVKTSNPSMSGSSKSRSVTAGGSPLVIRATASSPVATASTLYPREPRKSDKNARVLSSSSTTRIASLLITAFVLLLKFLDRLEHPFGVFRGDRQILPLGFRKRPPVSFQHQVDVAANRNHRSSNLMDMTPGDNRNLPRGSRQPRQSFLRTNDAEILRLPAPGLLGKSPALGGVQPGPGHDHFKIVHV